MTSAVGQLSVLAAAVLVFAACTATAGLDRPDVIGWIAHGELASDRPSLSDDDATTGAVITLADGRKFDLPASVVEATAAQCPILGSLFPEPVNVERFEPSAYCLIFAGRGDEGTLATIDVVRTGQDDDAVTVPLSGRLEERDGERIAEVRIDDDRFGVPLASVVSLNCLDGSENVGASDLVLPEAAGFEGTVDTTALAVDRISCLYTD